MHITRITLKIEKSIAVTLHSPKSNHHTLQLTYVPLKHFSDKVLAHLKGASFRRNSMQGKECGL